MGALALPSVSGGREGVTEVIETLVRLAVLLVQKVTSRPLLPTEQRSTHLDKTHTSFRQPQRSLCLHPASCGLVTGPVGD